MTPEENLASLRLRLSVRWLTVASIANTLTLILIMLKERGLL